MITVDRLREFLSYDPHTGIFIWVKSPGRKSITQGRVAGTIDSHGYIRIRLDGKDYRAHRLAWLYVFGRFPENEIDHINLLKADNRISNLREATHSENIRNRAKPSSNTSGYKGVFFIKSMNKFRAVCGANGKRHRLGYFTTAVEASEAYNKFAAENHGEFFQIT